MARVVIVDDQEIFLDKICKNTISFFKNKGLPVNITCYDNSQLLSYDIVENHGFDIYILDVEMPKINGIELAKEIKKRNDKAIIVFITSHIEFSLDAFDVNAYQYILKSQIDKKLDTVLECITKKLDEDSNYYLIETNSRYEKVYHKDIYYIYKDGKNAVFVREKDETYVRETMRSVFKELNAPEFIYINRGIIVNIIHIMKINSIELYMRNNQKVLISRSNLKNIKEKVHTYWKDSII